VADVVIDRLEITLDLDADTAEGEFVRLLSKHLARWETERQHRRATERILEAERNLPDVRSD
jgi:hypothetical protein